MATSGMAAWALGCILTLNFREAAALFEQIDALTLIHGGKGVAVQGIIRSVEIFVKSFF